MNINSKHQLNRIEPPYLKESVLTVTDDESFYMVTAHRYRQSQFKGYILLNRVSIAVGDHLGVTPANQFDAHIWDPN